MLLNELPGILMTFKLRIEKLRHQNHFNGNLIKLIKALHFLQVVYIMSNDVT